MNKKFLIGIIVAIVVFVIVAAIFRPILIGVALIGVCIYLVFMVRKKKTSLFHDQVEPKIAERRYKILKAFLLVAEISLAVFIVGVILHNALYGLFEEEEPISFYIAIFSLVPFAVGTIGSLVIFLKGRRKTR